MKKKVLLMELEQSDTCIFKDYIQVKPITTRAELKETIAWLQQHLDAGYGYESGDILEVV